MTYKYRELGLEPMCSQIWLLPTLLDHLLPIVPLMFPRNGSNLSSQVFSLKMPRPNRGGIKTVKQDVALPLACTSKVHPLVERLTQVICRALVEALRLSKGQENLIARQNRRENKPTKQ